MLKLSDILSSKARKKAKLSMEASDEQFNFLRNRRKHRAELVTERKRQDAYAEKTRKYNKKTKSFGVGWGGEPPKWGNELPKLPSNIRIRK